MKRLNENFHITDHCELRSAQRCLPESVIELVLKHGEIFEQKGDTSVVSLGKRQRRALLKELKELQRVLGKEKDIYAVVGGDGSVVTTGRQYRTIRHNH